MCRRAVKQKKNQTEYFIVGLKTVYNNIKFFIFQLICILAKMVKPLNWFEFFHDVFDAVLREQFCQSNYILPWGLFNILHLQGIQIDK